MKIYKQHFGNFGVAMWHTARVTLSAAKQIFPNNFAGLIMLSLIYTGE